MVSMQELVELNNQGDLGKMLAMKFQGERGHLCPRKDADLMIGFKSKAETPGATIIGEAVMEHYTKLGYVVEPSKSHGAKGNCFEAKIIPDPRRHEFVHIVITTFYPPTMGDEHNHLRITTTLFV